MDMPSMSYEFLKSCVQSLKIFILKSQDYKFKALIENNQESLKEINEVILKYKEQIEDALEQYKKWAIKEKISNNVIEEQIKLLKLENLDIKDDLKKDNTNLQIEEFKLEVNRENSLACNFAIEKINNLELSNKHKEAMEYMVKLNNFINRVGLSTIDSENQKQYKQLLEWYNKQNEKESHSNVITEERKRFNKIKRCFPKKCLVFICFTSNMGYYSNNFFN